MAQCYGGKAGHGQHGWLVLQESPCCPCQALGTGEGPFSTPAAMDLWDSPGDVVWGHQQHSLVFSAEKMHQKMHQRRCRCTPAIYRLEGMGRNRIISKSFPSHGSSIAPPQNHTARPHTHRSLPLIRPLSLSPDGGHPTHMPMHMATTFGATELAGLGTGSHTLLHEQAGT